MTAAKKVLQEIRGIVGIGDWIECLRQIGKGVGVIVQIDLHAAHINVADAARLKRLHGRDRSALVGVIV